MGKNHVDILVYLLLSNKVALYICCRWLISSISNFANKSQSYVMIYLKTVSFVVHGYMFFVSLSVIFFVH